MKLDISSSSLESDDNIQEDEGSKERYEDVKNKIKKEILSLLGKGVMHQVWETKMMIMRITRRRCMEVDVSSSSSSSSGWRRSFDVNPDEITEKVLKK